jgi:hypothetical protein
MRKNFSTSSRNRYMWHGVSEQIRCDGNSSNSENRDVRQCYEHCIWCEGTKYQFQKPRYETVLQALHQVWRKKVPVPETEIWDSVTSITSGVKEQSTSSRNRDMRQCYKHYIRCEGNNIPVPETETWDSVINITSGVKETKYQFQKPRYETLL